MKLNYDRGRNVSRDYQQEFRGINRKVRPSETEFVSAINLTSAEYPALTTRRERDFITDIGRCDTPSLCSLGDGSIAYIGNKEGIGIYIDGVKKYALTGVKMPQKIVKMGQYLCLFPSGIVYNLTDKSAKRIESVFDNKDDGVFSFTPCKLDGKVAIVSALIPSKASIGDMWYDTEANKSYLCTGVVDGWQKEKAIIYANNMDLAFATDRPLYAVQVGYFEGGLASGNALLYTFNGGTYISAETSVSISDKLPTSANDGAFVIVTDDKAKTNTLYQYRENAPKWAEYPTSCTRISASGADITDFFKEGDVVEVSEFGYTRVYKGNGRRGRLHRNGYSPRIRHLRIRGKAYANHPKNAERLDEYR